jgi:uncharacterized surface protein with fasciclin (FAS1) repeats
VRLFFLSDFHASQKGIAVQTGPFVVWAPTNEAFSAIDRESFNSILIDSSLLKDILTYHLTLFGQPYTLISAIKDELARPTVQGQVVRINVYRKKGSSFASKRVNIELHTFLLIKELVLTLSLTSL